MNRLGIAVVALMAVALLFTFIVSLRNPHDPTIEFAVTGKLKPKSDEIEKTEVFKTSDTAFYCRAKFEHPKEGWKLRNRWIAADVPGGPKDEEITSAVSPLDPKKETVEVNLKRPSGFPAGHYKLELYVDGPTKPAPSPQKTLELTVVP